MKVFSLVALTAALLGAIALVASGSSSTDASSIVGSLRRSLQSSKKELALVANKGVGTFPLGECEADCDSDADCADGLVCFERNGKEWVPGCSGWDPSGNDYCIRAGTSSKPEAEADAEAEAETAAPEATSATLFYAGNNGKPSSAFPLGICEGDCDTNKDCQDGLVCYQRDEGMPVPGCDGTAEGHYDYCIDPVSLNANDDDADADDDDGNDDDKDLNQGEVGSTSDAFGLHIYWEEGYFWQEETIERKWCLRCESSREECEPGRRVFLTECDTSEISQFEFLTAPNGAFFIKLTTNDLCLEVPQDTQDRLLMQWCDPNNEYQTFVAGDGAAEWGDRFEIHPSWASNMCVTNTHHPKFGESLYLNSCERARRDTISYWNFY